MHFQGQRGDVGLLHRSVSAIADGVNFGRVKQNTCWCIDQVKYRTQVDSKAILALTHKHFALIFSSRAAGDGNSVNVFGGVAGVVGNGFSADIVDWLLEGCATTGFCQGGH